MPNKPVKDPALAELREAAPTASRKTLRKLWKQLKPVTKAKVIFGVLAVLALVIALTLDVALNGPLSQLLSKRDRLVELVKDAGVLGPLIYIILQIIQTVVAPIPGQVVGSVGGFIFGPWGILWTTIGSALGWLIVFWLARRFGRPLLERIFKPSTIDKFDFILDSKNTGWLLLLILFIPGLPDDTVCYIAGLTTLSYKKLLGITFIGRFPAIVLTNYLGAGLSDNLGLVVAVSVVVVIILALAAWQRERIMNFLHRISKKDGKTVEKSIKKDDPKPSKSK